MGYSKYVAYSEKRYSRGCSPEKNILDTGFHLFTIFTLFSEWNDDKKRKR
jgi:hypothetical protein